MRFILWLILLSILITVKTTSGECNEKCEETEYSSYVDCLRKRIKRSTDCGNSEQQPCANCDCNFCVVNTCPENCGRCCQNNPPCVSKNCCHRTCHSRCKSTSCRTDCRKNCIEMLTVAGFNLTASDKPRHNITTIINLHNSINNTNIIDIPVQLNTTNHNNITVEDEDDELEAEEEQRCCYIISPRTCTKLEQYPYAKCVRYRKKSCGSFCIAPIMHEQVREICADNETEEACHEQKVYIPQPQPTCSYQPQWPYVSCGNIRQQNCAGCYDHYNNHFPLAGCSYSCYDDGYGQGPYYRQGPFYRPGYSHIPSCSQTGNCFPNLNYGYPNYGYPTYRYPAATYPPNSYGNVSQTHPTNKNHTFTVIKEIDVQHPPPSYYYPIPMFPPYISIGYQYPPPPPIYMLPPEVDIQAYITHPEKATRYAQITISKPQDET